MNKDKEIISDFECYGKQMVTVQVNHNVHVMSLEEWEHIYRNLYPEMGKQLGGKQYEKTATNYACNVCGKNLVLSQRSSFVEKVG